MARFTMDVTEPLTAWIDGFAKQQDITRTEVFRRALSVLKAADEQAKAGRPYLGFTANPASLDVQMIGLINTEIKPEGTL